MRAVLRTTFLMIAGAGALAVVACSSSDEANTTGDDSGTPPSSLPDAQVPDADVATDAGADVAFDAAPRECSDENFCHTGVPANENLRGVWGDGTGVVWAVADSGRILRWDGTTWAIHTATLENHFSDIWGSGPTDIWVVGSAGLMHGTGASSSALVFTHVDAPGDATVPLTRLWGNGPNDVWAVGGSQPMENGDWPYPATGRVVHYTGGGTGWENSDAPTDTAYAGIWGNASTGIWIQGSIEALPENDYSPITVVRRRLPGSTTWEQIALPDDPFTDWGARPAVVSAAGAGKDNSIWVAGNTQGSGYKYWRGATTDNGLTYTWTIEARNSWDLSLTGFWGNGTNDMWAIGDYGRLRHWDGKKWEQAAVMVTSAPVKNALFGIWGKSNDDFWVVGDGIALHKTSAAKP